MSANAPNTRFITLIDETQALVLQHATVLAMVAQTCKLASDSGGRPIEDHELLEGIAALAERATTDLNSVHRQIGELHALTKGGGR